MMVFVVLRRLSAYEALCIHYVYACYYCSLLAGGGVLDPMPGRDAPWAGLL